MFSTDSQLFLILLVPGSEGYLWRTTQPREPSGNTASDVLALRHTNSGSTIVSASMVHVVRARLPPSQEEFYGSVLIRGTYTQAKLYDTAGEHGRYVCLSHCWGQEDLIKTTKQNMQLFTHEIPWFQLPKSFQNAIYLYSFASVEYLWIDLALA